MRTRTFGAISIALMVPLVACSRTEPKEERARPVRVEIVQSQAEDTGLRYSANIQPYEQVTLAFKVGGYVREIQERHGTDGRPRHLQQGDDVKQGTVLARVQQDDYQEKVNMARGQESEARASLEKAKLDFERAERLYGSESLTRPDYDAAKAAFDMATARLESATAQLSSAEISLRDCTLVAPMDAVVLTRQVEAGTLASPGTAAVVLADIKRVKVVFGVPDHVAQKIKIGMAIPFTTETMGSATFDGRVSAISPSADSQSRVFSVELTVPNKEGRLKPGMIAAVQMRPGGAAVASPSLPSIPIAAVVKSEDEAGTYAVFIVEKAGEKDIARLRPVTLGPISGNRIAVTAGLTERDRVIVSGATLVLDGETVHVIR